MAADGRLMWWQKPAYMLALVLLAAVPLIYPDIPPLVDLPGHMGRYRVAMDLETSANLQRYFTYEWRPIGNLGVDLLVLPFAKLIGLEPAVKLIAILIPVLTVAGFLAVARAAHGPLTPTAAFAVPLAYSHPFQFGFVNFALSMALALLAFALWLWLGKQGRTRLRAAAFVPVGLVIWLAHSFGWGFLGLLCAGESVSRQEWRRRGLLVTLRRIVVDCLPLTPPLALMLIWRSEAPSGLTGDWFNVPVKLYWLAAILREHLKWFDVGSAIIVILLPYFAWRTLKLPVQRQLIAAMLICLAAFLLMPRIVFGSAYADMRLAPYIVALFILSVGSGVLPRRAVNLMAVAGAAFAVIRIGATTLHFAGYDRQFVQTLAAVEAIPDGAAVVALVSVPCRSDWQLPRMSHLPAMAIVRRQAFVNDQWLVPGANLLDVTIAASPYQADPSQMVFPPGCGPEGSTLRAALDRIPANRFDVVWLVGFPGVDDGALEPVFHTLNSSVYRIDPEEL